MSRVGVELVSLAVRQAEGTGRYEVELTMDVAAEDSIEAASWVLAQLEIR